MLFTQLIDAPASHRGKVVMIGGEVLTAKRLKDGTELEILQLPLDDSERPTRQRTASQGRFLALKTEFLDPATVPENTQVTIIGEITGTKLAPLDEMKYQYPTLTIKHLHVWKNDPYTDQQDAQPRWSIFGGGSTGGRVGGGVGIGIGFLSHRKHRAVLFSTLLLASSPFVDGYPYTNNISSLSPSPSSVAQSLNDRDSQLVMQSEML